MTRQEFRLVKMENEILHFWVLWFSEEALEQLNAVREHSERGDFCRCCDKNGRVRWRNEPVKDAKVLTIALPSVKWLFLPCFLGQKKLRLNQRATLVRGPVLLIFVGENEGEKRKFGEPMYWRGDFLLPTEI